MGSRCCGAQNQRRQHRTGEASSSTRSKPSTSKTAPSDLPNELLQRVLHAGGRHTRRVCRHWRAAYGPLDCGLLLSNPSPTPRRGPLALPPPHRSSSRTLALSRPWLLPRPSLPPRPPRPHPFASALPATLPRLTALDLDTTLLSTPHSPDPTPLAPHLAALAPLFPHLTALTLRNFDFLAQPLAAAPTSLPRLRSLSLVASDPLPAAGLTAAATAGTLATINALPNLRHLALTCRHPHLSSPCPSASLLPHLAALPPTLTYLDFGLCMVAPTHAPEDLHALSAALPGLRRLHLPLAVIFPEAAPAQLDALGTLAAALSQRQALTDLHLSLFIRTRDSAFGLEHVSCLHNLAALTLIPALLPEEDDFLDRAAAAVSRLGSLTSLTVNGRTPGLQQTGTLWPALAAAPALARLHWAGHSSFSYIAGVGQIAGLQSLELWNSPAGGLDWQAAGGQAVSAVLALTRLTRLQLLTASTELPGLLLAGVSGLVRLRQLHVNAVPDERAMSGLAAVSSDLTRLELDCEHCPSEGGTGWLRALGALPHSVRCLALSNLWAAAMLPVTAARQAALQRELPSLEGGVLPLERDLLPLPGGVRVLAISSPMAGLRPGRVLGAVEAAARRQDCVLVDALPADERHFGCNGYL